MLIRRRLRRKAAADGAQAVVISAAIESKVAQLEEPRRMKEFLESLGVGRNRVGKG